MQQDVIHIDSRSHLEVADSKHRYSKNLRLYFKEYDRLTNCKYLISVNDKNICPSSSEGKWSRYNPFFEWLDNNENLPNLKECPRNILDEDRVLYIDNEEERINYDIYVDIEGLWRKTLSNELINTGSKGWIFVLFDGRMLGCEKRTTSQDSSLRFHHSSFFAGAPVHAAGMIVCIQGQLIKLFPHSGHYRPHDRHLFYLLAFIKNKNCNLNEVQVDVQRIIKAARNIEKDGSKSKKFDSALYCDGITIYYFLKLKQKFHDSGLLNQIQKLRDKPEGFKSDLKSNMNSFDHLGADITVGTLMSKNYDNSQNKLEILPDIKEKNEDSFANIQIELFSTKNEHIKKESLSTLNPDPTITSSSTKSQNQYKSPSSKKLPYTLQLLDSPTSECNLHTSTQNGKATPKSGSQCSSGYATPTKWDQDLKLILSESPMLPPLLASPIAIQSDKFHDRINKESNNAQLKSLTTPRESLSEQCHHSSPVASVQSVSSQRPEILENDLQYPVSHNYSKDIQIQTSSTAISTVSIPKPVRLMNSEPWDKLNQQRDRSGSYSSTTAIGASSPNAFSPDAHISAFEFNHDIISVRSKLNGNIMKEQIQNNNINGNNSSYSKEMLYRKNQTNSLKENKTNLLPSIRSTTASVVSSASTAVLRDSSCSQTRLQHSLHDDNKDDDNDACNVAASTFVDNKMMTLDTLSLNSSKIGFVIGSPAPSFSSSLSSAGSLSTLIEGEVLGGGGGGCGESDSHPSLSISLLPIPPSLSLSEEDRNLIDSSPITKHIHIKQPLNMNNNEMNQNLTVDMIENDNNDDELFFGELEYNEKENVV